jgi:hypothetical protein
MLMAEAVDATKANFLPQLVYANFGNYTYVIQRP